MCRANQVDERLTIATCSDCEIEAVIVNEGHTGKQYCTGCMTNERLAETRPELYIKAMQEVVYYVIDFSKLESVELQDVDNKDYPDFVDANISYAEYNGVPMTTAQLEMLEDTKGCAEYVQELACERMYS